MKFDADPKVYVNTPDGLEEVGEDHADAAKALKAVVASKAVIDALEAEKGQEYTSYVMLLYNIHQFTGMLAQRSCVDEAHMLADLVGGWIGKMVTEGMCKNDPLAATTKLHEMVMDCQKMVASVQGANIERSEMQ